MKTLSKTLLLLTVFGLAAGKEYSVTLDPAEKFNVSWSVDDASSRSNITFTISVETTGWVGVGISPDGRMANSDIVVAWVTANGSSHLLDMYTTGYIAPTKDASQDVTLVSATEANGITEVVFIRKLDTGDSSKDNIIQSPTTNLVYAYGDSDPASSDGPTVKHSTRGTKSLALVVESTSPPTGVSNSTGGDDGDDGEDDSGSTSICSTFILLLLSLITLCEHCIC